jgi:hypothetical protein
MANALWLAIVLALAFVAASGGGTASRADEQTIYDPALGVTWLADANLARTDSFGVGGITPGGSMDYATAQTWVAAMDKADYLGHSNWMLPTTPTSQPGCQSHKGNGTFGFGCSQSPLPSLYSSTFALTAPDTAVPITNGDVGPFRNFQPYLYWTAKVGPTFSFNTGWAGQNIAKHDMYVLPMLVGNPFGIAGSGNGLFPGDGGAVVYEPSAGVTWLAYADLAKSETFGLSGIDADGSMPDTSLNGFQDLQPYLYWSCEGETAQGACLEGAPVKGQAWSFSFGNGFLGTDLVQNDLYVMVYYPGPTKPHPGCSGTTCR